MNSALPVIIRIFARTAMLALALISAPVFAASWNPDPWLEDLAQIQRAMHTKYANIEWLTKNRGYDLDRAFIRAADRIRAGGSEAEARAAIDRLFLRIADGHAEVRWASRPIEGMPKDQSAAPNPKVSDACGVMGYDSSRSSPALAAQLPGYRPLDGADDSLPAGTVASDGTTLGIIRIGEFDPHMAPALCAEAIAVLKLKPAAACAQICQDEIFFNDLCLAYGTARGSRQSPSESRRRRPDDRSCRQWRRQRMGRSRRPNR